MKLGNGANQRNRNSFVLCFNLCISYVFDYFYIGNGTGNREPLVGRNLCSLSLAICCNAEWIIEGYILQVCSGNAAEILDLQLVSHIGTLRVRQNIEVDFFEFFTVDLTQESQVQRVGAVGGSTANSSRSVFLVSDRIGACSSS